MPTNPMIADLKLFGFTGEEIIKLANIGCGAVCVLGVVISGYMIVGSGNTITSIKAGLIKFYMKVCIALALISGGSTILLAYNNAQKVTDTKQQAVELVTNQAAQTTATVQVAQATIKDLQTQLVKTTVSPPDRAKLEEAAKAQAKKLQDHNDSVNKVVRDARTMFKL